MPSFRIEMRDRSPQSRPAGWPAAGPQVMPRLIMDRGSRRSGVGRDAGGAGVRRYAEMRAVLGAIQMVDVTLHQHPPRVGGDRPLKDDHPSPDITF